MATTAVCGVIGGVGEIIGQCVNNGIDNLNIWDVAVETFTSAAYGAAAAIGAGTGSMLVKMATKGVIVAANGLNTFMHGIYQVQNQNLTMDELREQTARLLARASIIQFAVMGFDKIGSYVNVGNSAKWIKNIVPSLVTLGKTTYRHNAEIINNIAMLFGEIILWKLLRRFLSPQ